MSKFIDRTGEVYHNKYGTPMNIVKYNNSDNIIIEFQDEYKYKTHTNYRAFINGKVKNVYDKTVYGIGFIGEGKYSKKEYIKLYTTWSNMLKRCYSPNTISTYKDCCVDKYFHNLQNFGIWFEANYYSIKGEIMCLDKDILIKGNKIYGPETCIIVPERINKLFVKNNLNRGKLPIGVIFDKTNNCYQAKCSILDDCNKFKTHHLGRYKYIDDAFLAYKKFKEKYIKQIADEYKNKIPEKIYNALYSYEVNYND